MSIKTKFPRTIKVLLLLTFISFLASYKTVYANETQEHVKKLYELLVKDGVPKSILNNISIQGLYNNMNAATPIDAAPGASLSGQPYYHYKLGGDSSGGGNAEVCFASSRAAKTVRKNIADGRQPVPNELIPMVTSVKMLDLVKAQQIKKLLQAEPGETPEEFEERIYSRFEDIFPYAKTVIDYGKRHVSHVRSVPNGIFNINDYFSNEVFESKNCAIVTILLHQKDSVLYEIIKDQRFYDLSYDIFSIENRVASYLHEYFYIFTKTAQREKEKPANAVQTIVGTLFYNSLTFGELRQNISYFHVEFKDIPYVKYNYGIFGSIFRDFQSKVDKEEVGPTGKKLKTSLLATHAFPLAAGAAVADGGVTFFVSFVGMQIYAEKSLKKNCKKYFENLRDSGQLQASKDRAMALLDDIISNSMNSFRTREQVNIMLDLQRRYNLLINSNSAYYYYNSWNSNALQQRQGYCEVSLDLASFHDYYRVLESMEASIASIPLME